MIIRNASDKDIDSFKQAKPILDINTIKSRLNRQQKGEVEFLVIEEAGELVSFVLLKWSG